MIKANLPFPINVFFVVLVTGGFILFSILLKKKIQQQTIFNRFPSGDGIKKITGWDRFVYANPDFNGAEFLEKVKRAFIDIRKAREKQDLSGVRKFISDGVYRWFKTQFMMMNITGQTNTVDDPEVKNVYIDRVDTDGHYDIIHTAIYASVAEASISSLDPSLNSGVTGDSVEYWSFIKKRGTPVRDIYYTYNCPDCGNPLPEDAGEITGCASCGALTNSGEYDWVLAGIIRADDYITTYSKLRKSGDLNEKVRDLINGHSDFTIQNLEDKAGDGYLQIITAMALNDPSLMRRFVNDAAFEKITTQMTGTGTAYNGIYLNDVTLIGVSEDRTLDILAVSVKSSFRRVCLGNGSVSIPDPVMISGNQVMLMSRDKNSRRSRGSLYAYICPGCGAAVKNSLEVKCPHCRIQLNSTAVEWIITDIMTVPEYHDYYNENVADFNYSVSHDLIDKNYDDRDFAFNNMMVIMAYCGEFTEQGKEPARELAVKWKYNIKKLEPFFRMAVNGQLVIRMPEDSDRRQIIYYMMEEAAVSGRDVTPETWQLLEVIKQKYDIR